MRGNGGPRRLALHWWPDDSRGAHGRESVTSAQTDSPVTTVVGAPRSWPRMGLTVCFHGAERPSEPFDGKRPNRGSVGLTGLNAPSVLISTEIATMATGQGDGDGGDGLSGCLSYDDFWCTTAQTRIQGG